MLQTPSPDNSTLIEMFEPYEFGQEEMDRFKSRCLGQASLRVGSHMFSSCAFFEIVSDSDEEEVETVDEVCLPPKKRKSSCLKSSMRYAIVFCMEGLTELSLSHPFYLLPRHAVTDCLTSTAPHQIVISFFPPSSCDCRLTTDDAIVFKTALEELAAVCSHSCKLSTPTKSPEKGHVTNAMLSNVSFELYRAIKQMVFHYEQMCQNMMALMTLHLEQVSHHKSEMVVEKEIEPSSLDLKEVLAEEKKARPSKSKQIKSPLQTNNSQIKKCLYCGSKSTPMWRRGPQGAGTLCNACGVKWKHGKILNGHTDYLHDPPSIPPRRASKPEKKRKKSTHRRVTKKTIQFDTSLDKEETEEELDEEIVEEEEEYFAVPVMNHAPPVWEGQSTSSSTSEYSSPLESSVNIEQKQTETRRDLSFLSYDTETLSVYVGEDAVEAAAVLTLLKQS